HLQSHETTKTLRQGPNSSGINGSFSPFSTLQKTYRAMYDYMAADADEVSFKDGDTIVNVQAIDEGWMYGTVQRTGKTGMLPANYVEAV
uniref:SH3 domain-containing protein n=1 Tax=Cairina moschata TaxID=8855 RepID=A0A8C3GLA8_CAIMO